MIKIENLTKSFGNSKVLDGLNMNVNKGSIYGLIGVNGAGKTTLIKHIVGFLKADSGSVTIEEAQVFDNTAIKEKLGFIPDELFFGYGYSLKEMAGLHSKIYRSWSYEIYSSMLEAFNLKENQKLFRFSKGMKKQAAFILALSSCPDYLLLDEPFDGLDPLVRKTIRHFLIEAVAERNMTILVSSHNLRELEGICDSIGILSDGKLIIERDLENLKSDIHKVQLAFAKGESHSYAGLDVLHKQTQGNVDLLIIKAEKKNLESKISAMNPVVFDILPLSLEEIFIYELGGKHHDIQKII